jgi:4,5-DOPA dioxygenase extradiol
VPQIQTGAKNLPKPKAIMVISAHWLTVETHVTCMEKPRTIYDFYEFPDELYEIEYNSPGSPYDARQVVALKFPSSEQTDILMQY